jgi:hypothetical protein
VEALGRLVLEHGGEGLEVVILPTDPTVDSDELKVIRADEFPFPGVDRFHWLLEPTGETVLAYDRFGVGGVVIIDRKGRIAFQGRMTHTYEELKPVIEAEL